MGELVGAILAGLAGQISFGGLAGAQVHLGRQVREEAADLLDVPVPDEPVALSGRGRGQLRRQRLTGQRAAFARSPASAIRRLASALVIRSRSANAERSVPPNSSSPACASSWLINACWVCAAGAPPVPGAPTPATVPGW